MFRVQGSGFRVQGSGLGIQGSGFGVQDSGVGGCTEDSRKAEIAELEALRLVDEHVRRLVWGLGLRNLDRLTVRRIGYWITQRQAGA